MKLYLFDQKHENVLDEIEITNVQQVRQVRDFLERHEVTNKYRQLIIAKGYEMVYEDGERWVNFEYGGN